MASHFQSMDFKKMTVTQIKKFLIERGVSVNGYHKPSLIEIASSVLKMGLPTMESMMERTLASKLAVN